MKSLTQFIKWIFKPCKVFFVRKPKIVIVSHFNQDKTVKIIICDKEGDLQVHKLQQVARKKEIINQLSAKDAFLLGYLLAEQDQDNSFLSFQEKGKPITEV